MKIKTIKGHRRGQVCSTSIGEVKFDEAGIAEIPDDKFEELKTIMRDIEEVKDGSTVKKPSKKLDEPNANSGAENAGGSDDDSSKMAELPVEDLVELAMAVEGADKKAVKKMGKEELIAYIKDNMPK